MNYKVNNSPYWYHKDNMPDDVKNEIKKMVKGTIVDCFNEKNLLKVSSDIFKEVFIINRYYLYNGCYTEYPDENDYDNSDCYLLEDGLAGFAITNDGWGISIFSNSEMRGFAKDITKYVTSHIYKLCCIVSDSNNKLVDLYHNLYGFNIYAKSYNDEKAMRECYGDDFIDNFIKNRGIPHHAFMVNSKYYDNFDVVTLSDYYETKDYFDKTVDSHLKKGD